MALSGSWTHIWEENDPTLTDEVQTRYPVDLEADDPNYDKKGQITSASVPHINTLSQSYDDVYIKVQGASVYGKNDGIGTKERSNSFIYKVFLSEADSLISGSEIVRDTEEFDWNFISQTNPYSEAYTYLKTLDGFESLTDV